MENYIEEALRSIDLEAFYLYRSNELKECIVYSYTLKGASWADNKRTLNSYSILLNAYVDLNRDISQIRDDIIKAMEEKGFKLQPVPAPNKEKDQINIALRFKIVR